MLFDRIALLLLVAAAAPAAAFAPASFAPSSRASAVVSPPPERHPRPLSRHIPRENANR